eukprot:TRINITY_DN40766_c0_g1_i1.p1 TRINITY_DN40766_c0_g1~~TRINITY_DN40766_c0_g1_i1.p1  ORF type:complete len:1457 (+),score=191.80 TRINITY_DN40766_c0_g1_i1:373-4371(+)
MAAHDLSFPPNLTRVLSEVKSTIWFRIGVLHDDMGDFDAALTAFEKALMHNPNNASASSKAGLILLKKENFPRAIDYLDVSVRRDSSDAAAWAGLAHCYLMTDDLEHAYIAYHTTLQRKPHQTDPNLWFGIGVLYDRLGMLDEALQAFHSVLTVTPHYQRADEVYYAIGLIHKEQHKYEHAHEYMTKVMSVINNQQPAAYAEALYQIGHIHELAGSINPAMEAYQRSLAQNNNHTKCLQALAILMSKAGKHDDALSLLQRASRLDQTDAQIFYVMGRVAMATNNYHVAYESYQQAVYRDGKNADFWCAIGVLYFHMRQYRDAMDAYTRAIHINPRLPEVWYDMGTLYELYSQYNDAVDAYQHALQLQANDTLTNDRLAIVQRAIATRVPPQQPSALPRTAGPPLSPNPATAMRPHTKADFVARIGALPPPPQAPIVPPTVSSTPSHVPDRQALRPVSSPTSKLPAPALVTQPLPTVAEHPAAAVHPSNVVGVRDSTLAATAAPGVANNSNNAGAVGVPVMTAAPVSAWKTENPVPMDTTMSAQEPVTSAVHLSPPKHDRDTARRNEVDVASQLSSHRSRSPSRPKAESHPIGPRSPNVSKPSVVDQQTITSQIPTDSSDVHVRGSQHAPMPISSAPGNSGISSLVNKRSVSPSRSRPTFQEEPDRQEVVRGGVATHSPKNDDGRRPPTESQRRFHSRDAELMEVSPSNSTMGRETRVSPLPITNKTSPLESRKASKWERNESNTGDGKDCRMTDRKTPDRVERKGDDDMEGRTMTENGYRKHVSQSPRNEESRRYSDERTSHYPRGADNSSRHSGTSSYERKRSEGGIKRQRRHLEESDRFSPEAANTHKHKADRRRESNGSLEDKDMDTHADASSGPGNVSGRTAGGSSGNLGNTGGVVGTSISGGAPGGSGGGTGSRKQNTSGYSKVDNSGSNGSLNKFDVEEAMLPRLPPLPLNSKSGNRNRRTETAKEGSFSEGSRRRPRTSEPFASEEKGNEGEEGSRVNSKPIAVGTSSRLSRSPESRECGDASKRVADSKESRTPIARPFAFRSVPMPSNPKHSQRGENSASGREYGGGNESARKDEREQYASSPSTSRMQSPTRSNHDRTESHRSAAKHKSSEGRSSDSHGDLNRRRDEDGSGRISMRRRNEDGKDPHRERSSSAGRSGHPGREYSRDGTSTDGPFGSGAPASFSKSLSRTGAATGLSSPFGGRRGNGEKAYRGSNGGKGGDADSDDMDRGDCVSRGQKRKVEEIPSDDGERESSPDRRSGKNGVGRNGEAGVRRMAVAVGSGKVHGVEGRNGAEVEGRHNKRLRSINGLSEQSGDSRIRGKEV